MKFSIIKISVALCCLLTFCSTNLYADEYVEVSHKYDKRIHRYQENWNKIIPTDATVQYAGGMGLMSFGVGWDYGKRNQWETDVLFGFIPKYSSKRAKMTMTLKQNYIPWSFNITNGFSIEPLTCGMYFNTVFGSEFWVREPDKYPKGYYGFSTKIRSHIFLGQRFTFAINPEKRFHSKAISLFYELNTCDMYLITAITNKYLRPRDSLGLSFGLKFHFF